MLFALAAILFALWVLGVLTGTLLNGFIHLFVIASIVVVLVRLIRGELAQ